MVHPVSSMLGEIYTVMCVFTVSDKLIHIGIGCHKHVVGTCTLYMYRKLKYCPTKEKDNTEPQILQFPRIPNPKGHYFTGKGGVE